MTDDWRMGATVAPEAYADPRPPPPDMGALLAIEANPFGQPSMTPQPSTAPERAVMGALASPYTAIKNFMDTNRDYVDARYYTPDADVSQLGTQLAGQSLNAATLPMGTGAIAGVPVKGAEMLLGAGAVRGSKAAEKFPQFGESYPPVAPPVEAIDKASGKSYLAKVNSPEALQVQRARQAAQAEIDAGNYTPYFDVSKRFDVDPTKYPPVSSTLGLQMKKPETRAAYEAVTMSPASLARLEEAYQRGLQQADQAGNWYQMGQLEKEFIKEYGAKEGRAQFKQKFADAMAATTGGAKPADNLMMAHYGNYLKARGLPVPEASYQYPFPVGGRYAATNMDLYRKMIMEGGGITPANPKRYNFAGNFTGNTAGATIDEQMMGLIQPGKANPPPPAYGHYEAPVAALAQRHGVEPRYLQEVAWAGAKAAKTPGGYAAQPMIQTVNEAIERTSRITGLSPKDVVRRGLVRSEIPLYGLGGAAAMGALADPSAYDAGR